MDEYIERQKLYNNLVLLSKYETGERQQGILGCAETVRIFPAADAAPVVHGQWVHETIEDDDWGGTYHSWSCSECKFSVGRNPTDENFCPNCGARMDGGVDHA